MNTPTYEEGPNETETVMSESECATNELSTPQKVKSGRNCLSNFGI